MLMKQLAGIAKEITEVARLSGRSFISICSDYLRLKRTNGLSWSEYYSYGFEKQTPEFRRGFLSGQEEGVYLERLNPYKYYIIGRNKYLTHLALEDALIPTAELYCYYSPESGSATDVRISCDLTSTKKILERKNVSECVIKAPEESHGDKVFAVSRIEYGEVDAIMETSDGRTIALSSILHGYPLLFEQRVNQSDQFNEFNPSSVNTVRFMTTLMPDGEARVIATFLKIGRAGAFVDNAGGGGNVDTGVDVATGEIYGAIEFNGFRRTKDIDYHPDTGARLNGVRIKDWKQICDSLCDFQQRFPFLKAVGWDVAITDNGPVIIEVNDAWDTTGQLFIRRGWRDEIRRCYFAWKEHNGKIGVSYHMGRKNPASEAFIRKIERGDD
jgi:hypothetical protein